MTGGPGALEPIDCQSYVYDAWNRLIQVVGHLGDIQQHEYDGLHRRIIRNAITSDYSDGGVRHYYYNEHWQVLEERQQESGQTTGEAARVDVQYVYHPYYVDAVAVRYRDGDKNGTSLEETVYYYQDANFNVTALGGTSGAVFERYYYTPYGEVTILNGPADTDSGVSDWSVDADQRSDVDNEILFTGRERDPETGLQLNRWRFYASHLGRWASRDPIGYIKGAENLYEYGGGSPTDRIDPNGKLPIIPICIGIGIGLRCGGCRKETPPRTDDECCDDAEKAELDKGHAGGVVCCDGRKVSCGSWKDPSGSSEADPMLRQCVKEHEDDHHDVIPDCPGGIPSLTRPSPKPGMDRMELNKEECAAYKVELDCLAAAKGKCKTEACERAIQNRIDFIKTDVKDIYKCTNF